VVDTYLNLDKTMLETVPVFTSDLAQAWGQFDQRSRYNERRDQKLIADPTGQMMLLIWDDRTELWDVTGPTLKMVLHRSTGSFEQVAASPDGGSVAGMSGYNVEIWDIAKGGSHTSLDLFGAGGYLYSIFWQQESFRGLFMNDTGGGRWLDLPTSSALYNIEAVYEPIYSADGRYMATRGNDWAVVIYNLDTGEKVSSFVPSPMDTQVTYAPLAFSPDGRILVNQVRERECSCSVVSLWDTATGQKMVELGEFNRYAHTAAFTSDGATLILGGGGYTENHDGGSIEIWEVATGTRLKRFDGFDLAVQQLAISSDNRFVAGIAYGEIHLWDLTADNEAGRLLIKGGGSTSDGFSMALFNPQGDMLFVASEWGYILIFDVATGEKIKTLTGHSRQVDDLLFVDEGRTLLSTGSDGSVRLWSEPGNVPDLSSPIEQPAVPTIAMTPTVGTQ
jgi:WD40 repeat protein